VAIEKALTRIYRNVDTNFVKDNKSEFKESFAIMPLDDL
jgi:hypothetical protein